MRIELIPGDGIGVEIGEEVERLLFALDRRFQLGLDLLVLDYGAERFLREARGLPPGELDRMKREADAVVLIALGDPRIPDMRHGREILLAMRQELGLYANVRPVRCLDASLCPLRDVTPETIDFVVYRENREGAYAGATRWEGRGESGERAINEEIHSRHGVERLIRAGCNAARRRRQKVTLVDKSNAIEAHRLWRESFERVATEFSSLHFDAMYVDAMALAMIQEPERFDVIVTTNLFGDILTDLAAALQGGLGMAASANLGDQRLALFEPVHGSAPTLVGKGSANPMASFLSLAMMFEHLASLEVAEAIRRAVLDAVRSGVRTLDIGGRSSTREVADAVIAAACA